MDRRPSGSHPVYTEVKFEGTMRTLTAGVFVTFGTLWLIAADDPPPAPSAANANVTITPRARSGKEIAPESVLHRRADIRVDTQVWLIPVAVTDPMSRFVTGLERENFKLSEDK